MATAMHPQPQHLTALQFANQRRSRRADIKRRLGGREVQLEAVIGDQAVATMILVDLLKALPRYGYTRAEKACELAGINPARKVGLMTDRERRVVCEVIA